MGLLQEHFDGTRQGREGAEPEKGTRRRRLGLPEAGVNIAELALGRFQRIHPHVIHVVVVARGRTLNHHQCPTRNRDFSAAILIMCLHRAHINKGLQLHQHEVQKQPK